MTNDIIKAVSIVNGLVFGAAGFLSLMPIVPIALDVACALTATSMLTIAGWTTAFTIGAVRKSRKEKP
ncbi:hypothetical protein [Novosphingobium sp.]|uniref:hypothetical protein n=1 Tax=Novosphingobium sp. TaxID=1874826 RepID=UPI002FE35667